MYTRRVDPSDLTQKISFSEKRKYKKTFGERHGDSDWRGDRSSSFIVKKARISLEMQMHLDSLRTRVVSLEDWILQIIVWTIITWETSTMVPVAYRDTGPHLWHTCPTRHLKVQNYEDTCEVGCVTQKDNEFERQPSLSRLLKDTVRVYSVRLLRR